MNQQTPKQENALMRATLFVFFVSGASSVLMGNLMPFLREAYDISYTQAGFLLSLPSWDNIASIFIASFMFYPYYEGFNIWVLLGHRFRNVCNNLGFAYFSQLLFIQPPVRRLFKLIFCRQIEEKNKVLDKRPEKLKPGSEMEAIQDVYHRMDEIKKGI